LLCRPLAVGGAMGRRDAGRCRPARLSALAPLAILGDYLLHPASAQPRLPDVPAPQPFPDLLVDGEWWYYKLLDTSFPHGVPLLSGSSVAAGSGPNLFKQLPEAEYVLMEFFVPWCPHCQRFAPELAKVVEALQSPQARSGSLVAVRSVDCERSELKRACDWAGAHMFPKLLLAPRSSFLDHAGARSAEMPGAAEIFAISEASQVMDFLAKHVPNWPADMPAPSPRAQGAPFFGWAQPPEGVVEPPRVQAQDLAVAATSLLHTAFSAPNFDAPTKAALFDLLHLLCVAGPGDTCRQSACAMRTSLDRDWEQLVSRTTISGDYEGIHVDALTVTTLSWARVEHEHRWCGRPWPDFAEEGWDWCRGRTPGTRGYTCGLWMLFHSLLAGVEHAQLAEVPPSALNSVASLAKPPMEIVRGTVQHFFGCAECRQHFLEVPVTPADTASPAAQIMWLWSAHDTATIRIGGEERERNPEAPARLRWPTVAGCPTCLGPDGRYAHGEVLAHLRRFYGPAYHDESQAAPAASPRVVGMYEQRALVDSEPILLEVFYFTLCPHCEYFLTKSLLPLVEAQLPGDKVQIHVVPMYPPLLQAIRHPETCKTSDVCHLALAPLCAFHATSLRPWPADSPELLRGTRFAVCDIADTAAGRGRDDARTANCASKAGISWEGKHGLRECAEGSKSIDLLGLGSRLLLPAMTHLYNDAGFKEPPSMPWVMVDGKLLSCDGPNATCAHEVVPNGTRPLPTSEAGTLLELVCKKLRDPSIKGCAGVRFGQQERSFMGTPEVHRASASGELRRRPSEATARWTGVAAGVAGVVAAALVAFRTWGVAPFHIDAVEETDPGKSLVLLE